MGRAHFKSMLYLIPSLDSKSFLHSAAEGADRLVWEAPALHPVSSRVLANSKKMGSQFSQTQEMRVSAGARG